VPAPHTTKKEQTPLPSLLRTPTGFLGGSFGVSGTPPAKPSDWKSPDAGSKAG
jgi:hypothetical protein